MGELDTLTVGDLYAAEMGMRLGITVHRRTLEAATGPSTLPCLCGNPATLWSTDLLPTEGKVLLFCVDCARKALSRAR